MIYHQAIVICLCDTGTHGFFGPGMVTRPNRFPPLHQLHRKATWERWELWAGLLISWSIEDFLEEAPLTDGPRLGSHQIVTPFLVHHM